MFMTAEEYLAEAVRYENSKGRATDPFSRLHFEATERSFRTVGASEAALAPRQHD